MTPDFTAIAALDARAVVVTARSDDDAYDFVSRCFGPRVGINEDPVTGSAHCALATYWAERLGRTEFRAYQASARGGSLRVTLDGDRVRLGGGAVTITRGQLIASPWQLHLELGCRHRGLRDRWPDRNAMDARRGP